MIAQGCSEAEPADAPEQEQPKSGECPELETAVQACLMTDEEFTLNCEAYRDKDPTDSCETLLGPPSGAKEDGNWFYPCSAELFYMQTVCAGITWEILKGIVTGEVDWPGIAQDIPECYGAAWELYTCHIENSLAGYAVCQVNAPAEITQHCQ